MDDHVSKLEHMGKETVKKLQDIHGAAIGSGIDISVPTNCINKGETADSHLICVAPEATTPLTSRGPRVMWVHLTTWHTHIAVAPSQCKLLPGAVGEFRKLALLAEQDGHLRQKLQQVLKLSKEKWDDARDHAMRAVVADNRMRIW